MKQRLYALAFFALSLALTSCNKDDDDEPAPAVPEVVGKWSVDYGLLSGFSDASINGSKLDPFSELYWGDYFYTSQIHILNNSNKSFVEVIKSQGLAEDLVGTWTYDQSTLTLKYNESNINDEVFTYRVTNGLEELLSAPMDIQLDTATSGKIQYVYRK